MKHLKTSIILLLFSAVVNAQGSPIVHDPTNATHLITLKKVLDDIDKAQKEVTKRLKSVKFVKEAIKYEGLISALEQTHCQIKDYKFYQEQIDFESNRNYDKCSLTPKMSMEIEGLENYMNQIKMAVTSPLLSLDERTNMLNNSYKEITTISKSIDREKKKVKLNAQFMSMRKAK